MRLVLFMLFVACTAPQPPGLIDGGVMDGGVMRCDVTAPTECTDAGASLRWADVKPIFDAHCLPCHYGQVGGPWPLTTYTDVADWHDTVRDDLAFCTMPPADAGTELPRADREAVLGWLRCGYPR